MKSVIGVQGYMLDRHTTVCVNFVEKDTFMGISFVENVRQHVPLGINELCDWLIDKFGCVSSFGVCLLEKNTYILYEKDAVAFFHDEFGHLVCWTLF